MSLIFVSAVMKRWLQCSTLGALLLLTACSAPAPKPVPDANAPAPIPQALMQDYQKGVALLKDKQYSQAQSHWQRLANTYDQYAGVWSNLALSHLYLDQYEQGLTAAERAQSLDSAYCPVRPVLAILQREQGQFARAEQSYRAALACDPRNADVWTNLGILYDVYMNQPKQALEAYQHSQTLRDTPDKYVAVWIKLLAKRLGVTLPKAGSKPAADAASEPTHRAELKQKQEQQQEQQDTKPNSDQNDAAGRWSKGNIKTVERVARTSSLPTRAQL